MGDIVPMLERLTQAVVDYENAKGVYSAAARAELNEARAAIESEHEALTATAQALCDCLAHRQGCDTRGHESEQTNAQLASDVFNITCRQNLELSTEDVKTLRLAAQRLEVAEKIEIYEAELRESLAGCIFAAENLCASGFVRYRNQFIVVIENARALLARAALEAALSGKEE